MELINTEVEVNEPVVTNDRITYDIYFDGNNFVGKKNETEEVIPDFDKAPDTLTWKLTKKLEDFTDEEKQTILDYRGMRLKDDGFELSDIFMEASYIELI